MEFRIEKDTLGLKEVPREAYYGVQTVRAIENFPISGLKLHPQMNRAIGYVKQAAAEANLKFGLLEKKLAGAIITAARQVVEGKFDGQFMVDAFQAGAGTSYNMNANEIIANRAIELLGGQKGDYSLVHPNDHVNMAQSTNDVFPTAMRLAGIHLCKELLCAIEGLALAFDAKAGEFDAIIKSGRTHLQDAVPIRLGQEFKSYSSAIRKGASRIDDAIDSLHDLGIGGTAVGTGINTHPDFRRTVVDKLCEYTRYPLRVAPDPIVAINSMADFAYLSSCMKDLSLEIIKIANDLRLMSCGPRTGLAEITLPAVQPGSSIMPGKVNPVMAEMINMVCFHAAGNDLAVSMAAQAGQFELNVMMPVIAHNIFESLAILKNGVKVFKERCIEGITANAERCKEYAEMSAGLATALNPYIGYEKAASVAKEAVTKGKSVRQVILERGILTEDELKDILEPYAMTEPKARAKGKSGAYRDMRADKTGTG